MNTATNQIVGQTYDSNGNQLSSSGGTLTYDAENRVLTAPGLEYGYDSTKKRVWRGTLSGGVLTQTVYAYGTDGQLLGTYSFVQNGYQYADNNPTLSVYFAGKRVGTSVPNQGTAGFVQDRLGSSGKYYPFGEARGTVPQDAVGFATYTNDSATGLEYADQRYYASNFGRFMSPDPYRAGGGPSDPQSWNRYGYVEGDPMNFLDPRGLYILPVPMFIGNLPIDGGGRGGCEAVLNIAADPESDTPGEIDCLFYGFGQSVSRGGMTGAMGPSAGVAHSPGSKIGPPGFSATLALLSSASSQCLKDLNAPSDAAAANKLTSDTITYTWGLLPVLDSEGNVVNQAAPAESNSNQIWLNLNYGYFYPQNILVGLASGGYSTQNFLSVVGNSVGDPGLTTSQYYELLLLHELGHQFGVPQESQDSPYNTNIFNDCINGH